MHVNSTSLTEMWGFFITEFVTVLLLTLAYCKQFCLHIIIFTHFKSQKIWEHKLLLQDKEE
jgi:hypothetical protein